MDKILAFIELIEKIGAKGTAIILAIAVMAIIGWLLAREEISNALSRFVDKHTEYEINVSYKEKENEKTFICENKSELSDGWFFVQGQIVVCDAEGKMIKTFLLDDMFTSKAFHLIENSKWQVSWNSSEYVDKFEELLENHIYEVIGYSNEEITIKRIGLVCIEVLSKNQENWITQYYLLEGHSLTKIDKDVADRKMQGVYITPERLENVDEMQQILVQMEEAILQELDKKD